MMLMLESMMRVNELRLLTVGQCRVIRRGKDDSYVLIDVQGKTGHRQAVAGGAIAVEIIKRRSSGLNPGDRLFPYNQRDAFRELLVATDLRTDAFGNDRNLKSIRATAISFRVLNKEDLVMIARAAGTSVTMIDRFYAQKLSAEMGDNWAGPTSSASAACADRRALNSHSSTPACAGRTRCRVGWEPFGDVSAVSFR